MKRNCRSAFTMMEMAVTSGITAAVVGTTCTVTLMCAKLTQSSVSTTTSGSNASGNIQTLSTDISKADAILNSYTFSGGAAQGNKKYKTGETEIILRVPKVDSAGRPLQGRYRVVYYGLRKNNKGKWKLYRLWTEVIGNIAGPANGEELGQAGAIAFGYRGKSSKCGGAIKNTTNEVTDLTTGLYDGAVTVDPSAAVLPNVSGAIYVNVEIQSEDKQEKQKLRTGVRLRNAVL
jgi:hypothetical protein